MKVVLEQKWRSRIRGSRIRKSKAKQNQVYSPNQEVLGHKTSTWGRR